MNMMLQTKQWNGVYSSPIQAIKKTNWSNNKTGEPLHGVFHEVLKNVEHTIVFSNGRRVAFYSYPRIIRSFISPLINDFNLNFTGGWFYFDSKEEEYQMLINTVIAKKKPAGFFVGEEHQMRQLNDQARRAGLVTSLHAYPKIKDKWELGIGQNLAFGKTFILENAEIDYAKWGLNYNLTSLHDHNISKYLKGFNYAEPFTPFDLVITGLLLGYPIETTAAILAFKIQ